MRPVHAWVFASLLASILVGCTTPTSATPTDVPSPATAVPSIIPTQTQVRVSTPINTQVVATIVPTEETVTSSPVTADQMAFMTADGYHAFGDPTAPVVMFDYSDFF